MKASRETGRRQATIARGSSMRVHAAVSAAAFIMQSWFEKGWAGCAVAPLPG